jgi:hypothetical protein
MSSSQIDSIVELINNFVKTFKMPKSQIEEMANKIAENPPDHHERLYKMIGETLAKPKKSSVVKANEICEKLFV